MADKRIELLKKNQTQRPELRLDIYVKVRHKNALPEIPMGPKFMELPFLKLSRFEDYRTTQLEKKYQYELTAERDLDINVDLVDTKKYVAMKDQDKVTMDPEDQFLLEEDEPLIDKRRASHGEAVSWMRKIQYLGSEDSNGHEIKSEKSEKSRKAPVVKFISDVSENPEASRARIVRQEEEKLRKAVKKEARERRAKERQYLTGLSHAFLEDRDDYDDDDSDYE